MGRSLKRAVHQFGTQIRDGVMSTFYHGIGEQLALPTYIGEGGGINIFGPLSTTSSFEVAANFTNHNNGLIIEFADHIGLNKYYRTGWLSDYRNESEYLFIQNKYPLFLRNIVNVEFGNEYNDILNAIRTSDDITTNGPITNNADPNLVNNILKCQLPASFTLYKSFPFVDEYAEQIINTYCNNKKMMTLNYWKMNISKYSVLLDLFWHKKYEWIKLKEINAIFPNIEEIHIRDIRVFPYSKTLILDDLLSHCSHYKTNIQSIKIYNIASNIDVNDKQLICKYEKRFNSMEYSISIDAEDCLCIQRDNIKHESLFPISCQKQNNPDEIRTSSKIIYEELNQSLQREKEYATSLKELHDKLQEKDKLISILRTDSTVQKDVVCKLQLETSQWKNKFDELQQNKTNISARLKRLHKRYINLENEYDLTLEENDILRTKQEANAVNQMDIVFALQTEASQCKDKFDQLQQNKSNISNRLEQLHEKYMNLENEHALKLQEKDKLISTLRREQVKLDANKAHQKIVVSELQTDLLMWKDKFAELQQNQTNMNDRFKQLHEESIRLENEQNLKRQQFEAQKTKINQLNKEKQELLAKNNKLNDGTKNEQIIDSKRMGKCSGISVLCDIGDDIEFNSDPDDTDDVQSHIHHGTIIRKRNNSEQIRIKLKENKQIYSYFMDEIHIKNVTNVKQRDHNTSNNNNDEATLNMDQIDVKNIHEISYGADNNVDVTFDNSASQTSTSNSPIQHKINGTTAPIPVIHPRIMQNILDLSAEMIHTLHNSTGQSAQELNGTKTVNGNEKDDGNNNNNWNNNWNNNNNNNNYNNNNNNNQNGKNNPKSNDVNRYSSCNVPEHLILKQENQRLIDVISSITNQILAIPTDIKQNRIHNETDMDLLSQEMKNIDNASPTEVRHIEQTLNEEKYESDESKETHTKSSYLICTKHELIPDQFKDKFKEIEEAVKNKEMRVQLIKDKRVKWHNSDKVSIFGKKTSKSTKPRQKVLTKEQFVKSLFKANDESQKKKDDVQLIILRKDKNWKIVWIVQIEKDINIGISLELRKKKIKQGTRQWLMPLEIHLDIKDERKCECLSSFICCIDDLKIVNDHCCVPLQQQLYQQIQFTNNTKTLKNDNTSLYKLQETINHVKKHIKSLDNLPETNSMIYINYINDDRKHDDKNKDDSVIRDAVSTNIGNKHLIQYNNNMNDNGCDKCSALQKELNHIKKQWKVLFSQARCLNAKIAQLSEINNFYFKQTLNPISTIEQHPIHRNTYVYDGHKLRNAMQILEYHRSCNPSH